MSGARTQADPSGGAAAASGRLLSIDALRGFDMFWIIGGDALFRALGRYAGEPWQGIAAKQLEHAEWDGFRFYDLIFPLFLFLVGVVIPFSLRSHERRGDSKQAIAWRIFKRVALLFGLGLLCNGICQLDFENLRITGVLQRIGICYGIAAFLVWRLGTRSQAVVLAAILLGYWALLALVTPPGGQAGDYTKVGNLVGYVDRHYLPGKIMEEYYGYGDNEGLLSMIPAVATALLGALAGQVLLSNLSQWRKVLTLVVAGLGSLAGGVLWSQTFPIIKNIWTSSFVLFAGGFSLLLLALFYLVIDVMRWRWWAFFFAVIGANAITIYVVPRFVDFRHMADFFFGGVAGLAGELGGPVVLAAGVLALKWLFLYYLYRNRLFLRV